jgi:hypothetical protein
MPADFPALKLTDGRAVFAEEIHIGQTYAGLLVGTPNDEINRGILNGLPQAMQRIFRNAPVYILPPEVERRTEPYPMGCSREVAIMPPIELAMRFVSYAPIIPGGDASQLVVVWHQHEAIPLLSDAMRVRLERLNWNDNAQDFSC